MSGAGVQGGGRETSIQGEGLRSGLARLGLEVIGRVSVTSLGLFLKEKSE